MHKYLCASGATLFHISYSSILSCNLPLHFLHHRHQFFLHSSWVLVLTLREIRFSLAYWVEIYHKNTLKARRHGMGILSFRASYCFVYITQSIANIHFKIIL